MEKFNGLAVPPTNIDWEELQGKYCEFTEAETLDECAHGKCNTCLFCCENLNEFKNWFKSNLKNDKREENTQP